MKSDLLQVRHKLAVSSGHLPRLRSSRCVNLFKIWCAFEGSDQLTRAHLRSQMEPSEGLPYPLESYEIRNQGTGTVIIEADDLENRKFKLWEDSIRWRLDIIPDTQIPKIRHGNRGVKNTWPRC